jgi:hypothetical protein
MEAAQHGSLTITTQETTMTSQQTMMTSQQTNGRPATTPTPTPPAANTTTYPFTLMAEIKPDQVEAFKQAIAKHPIGSDESTRDMMEKIGTVHYARWATLDDKYVVFASEFDGDVDDYLDDFYAYDNGQTFDKLMRFLVGWPGPNNHDAFIRFWKEHGLKTISFYSYYPNATTKDVRTALRVRGNLEAVLQDFE